MFVINSSCIKQAGTEKIKPNESEVEPYPPHPMQKYWLGVFQARDMKWSVYFQTPEYLEQTRKFLILPEYEPLVRKWCGVRDGIRILDVGCGTGYFTRLLTKGGESVHAVGIDIEETFIRYAREASADLPIEFQVGDALALPFEDASFDLVTSHTFFTSISDPVRAMDEMKRVLKPGGMIASVTAMSFMHNAFDMGVYPEECSWARP